MVIEWKQAIGIRQDPFPLNPFLIGGGAEGAGLWSSQYSLHEGSCSDAHQSAFKITALCLK